MTNTQDAPPSTHYLVEFDRVGRNHDVAPLNIMATDADEAAFHIYTYVKTMLLSRGFEIQVNLETGTGSIIAGFHDAGTFTLTQVDAQKVQA